MPARKPTLAEFEQLQRERDFLRKQLDDRRREPGDSPVVGCGDSSCLVVSRVGMGGQHTNGGCRCERTTIRRALAYWRRVAEFREETIRGMKRHYGDFESLVLLATELQATARPVALNLPEDILVLIGSMGHVLASIGEVNSG